MNDRTGPPLPPPHPVDRWWRRAAEHRRGGRPLAALRAYRAAVEALDATHPRGRELVAEYAALLVELGRDGEAAALAGRTGPPDARGQGPAGRPCTDTA